MSSANQQPKRKSNFSIENILSRSPEHCQVRENRQKLLRQNPFQNNHVLFDQNKNFCENYGVQYSKRYDKDLSSEIKIESETSSCHSEMTESCNVDSESHDMDNDTSDDGNNQCKDEFEIFRNKSVLWKIKRIL